MLYKVSITVGHVIALATLSVPTENVHTYLIERLRSNHHSMLNHALMMFLLFAHSALSTTLSFLKLVQFSTTSSSSTSCRFDFESLMKSSMISSHLFKFIIIAIDFI